MMVSWRGRKGQDLAKVAGETPGWQVPGLDFPTFRMTLLSKAMDRATIRQLAEGFGLSYAQWRVLARLGDAQDGATVGQVAQQAWADRAEVSRAASVLEQRGLLERRDNPQDRRAPLLALNRQGKALYARVVEQRAAFHRRLIRDLDAQQVALLEEVIETLREAVTEISAER